MDAVKNEQKNARKTYNKNEKLILTKLHVLKRIICEQEIQ